jgi:hypothetical protein
MERRIFLKSSLAAGISISLPRVAFLYDSASAQEAKPIGEFLTAQMIWSSESVPVPLKANGPAAAIASSSDGHQPVPTPDLHVVFAREFSLESVPSQASIRLFSYTRYRLYINGIYSGRGPGRFQNQRPEYDTREISGALRKGRNLIAVLVHRDAPTGRIMRHDPGFAAVVHLQHGSTPMTIATDPSWLAKPDRSFGPRDEAWASIEEHIDARNGFDLTNPGFAPAAWTPSILTGGPELFPVWPRTAPLQSETPREWSATGRQVPVVLQPGQEFTADLPEIIQGYHNLELDSEDGSEIEIAYQLPQGAQSGKSTYIARRGPQRYIGGDTFAFSRLSIRLSSGRATLRRAEAIEVRYPFQRVGSFQCSDPLLTQLWTICARSLELLSEDSYVDCADRERVEWTDDSPPAFDCTRVIMRGPTADGKEYWGDNRLLKALLRRIALTQTPEGQLKAHSCSERWDIHAIMEDRSCDWVVLLRDYFDSSGDIQLVNELWPTLKKLIQWFLDRRTARGLVQAREWEVWDNPLRYQVCEGAGLNAMFYRALSDAAYLGNKVGELSDSQSFAADADRLKSGFNTLLWNNDQGGYYGGLFGPGSKTAEQLNGRMFTGPFVDGHYQPTAQAALFALYSGIVPADRLNRVRSWLLAHLDQVTGPMSHYYLFHALLQMEEQKQDMLALDRMRTGWKLQVGCPWQTTWEELVDGGGSKAHMYGMSPGYFLTAFTLGARRVGPVSSRSILIEPRCADLAWACGIAVTEFGPVEINWSKGADGALSIECSAPPDTAATLRLYKQGRYESVSIDHQTRNALSKGNFIEVQLTPGKHAIQYPV